MSAPDPTERVFAITRPGRGLMAVYLIHGLGRAAGLLGLGAIVAGELAQGNLRRTAASLSGGWPLVLLGAYAVAYLVVVTALFVRYATLRFRFDAGGVGQSSGLVFKRETFVAYARIQDIRIRRSIFEKAFGLGTVEVETASAGSGPELVLDGLRDHQLVADFLRAQVRARGAAPVAPPGAPVPVDALALLGSIRDEVRALRAAVERRRAVP